MHLWGVIVLSIYINRESAILLWERHLSNAFSEFDYIYLNDAAFILINRFWIRL